jgi:hypothetical protein
MPVLALGGLLVTILVIVLIVALVLYVLGLVRR